MEMSFFKCRHCGQIVAIVKKTNAPLICCGEEMDLLVPGTSDGSFEKHVPVFEKIDNKVIVKVGSVPHPSLDNHFIEWIALVTKNGNQRKILKPLDKPEASFFIDNNDEVISVYAYCNLHGLWKA